MSRRRVTESPDAPARGRVRTPGHGGRGDRGARGARRSACPRRRADARQRDEAARGRARGARRPRRPRRAAYDRILVGRAARDRRDGDAARSSSGSSEVEVARPILAEVAATIADVQVRNRGTIGGNVCVSDPTNHFPPLLVALDATFTIRGQGGERTVSASEFFVGVYMTAVGEGELLTKVNVPASSGAGDGYAGLTIGTHGTYIVNAAATVSGDAARVAIGCVAASPVRATAMEERLAGGDYSERRGARRRRGPRRLARPAVGRPRLGATTDVIWRRSPPCAPCCRRRGGGSSGGAGHEPHDLGRGERRADRATTSRRDAFSSTSSATTSASRARTSAATPATAARAPCT